MNGLAAIATRVITRLGRKKQQLFVPPATLPLHGFRGDVFENVDNWQMTDGQSVHAYATSSPMNLRLLWVNNHWKTLNFQVLTNYFMNIWGLVSVLTFTLKFLYLVTVKQVFLLVLKAGCGIWLYQFLNIAYLFTLFTVGQARSTFCVQDQDRLLVKRQNDNHSPGPLIRDISP